MELYLLVITGIAGISITTNIIQFIFRKTKTVNLTVDAQRILRDICSESGATLKIQCIDPAEIFLRRPR
jgi:hypothetical protein